MTFRIDANGILSVEAKDLGTGRGQSVSVTPTSGLNQTEIDSLVAEGDKFKETDQLRRDMAEMKNQCDTLMYTTEQALEVTPISWVRRRSRECARSSRRFGPASMAGPT